MKRRVGIPMMTREGEVGKRTNISSASAELRSLVHVTAVSPKDESVQTCGFTLTDDQAIELATYLLAVAHAKNASGLIRVTGRSSSNTVTVIRRIGSR